MLTRLSTSSSYVVNSQSFSTQLSASVLSRQTENFAYCISCISSRHLGTVMSIVQILRSLSKTSYIYAADLSNCHTLDYKDPSHQGSRIRSVRILVFEGYVRTLINVFYFSVYVNKNRIEYVATTTQ